MLLSHRAFEAPTELQPNSNLFLDRGTDLNRLGDERVEVGLALGNAAREARAGIRVWFLFIQAEHGASDEDERHFWIAAG